MLARTQPYEEYAQTDVSLTPSASASVGNCIKTVTEHTDYAGSLCCAGFDNDPRCRACVASSSSPAFGFAFVEPLEFREKSAVQ